MVLAVDGKSSTKDFTRLFPLLKSVTEGGKEEVDSAEAEAYLEAHELRPQEISLGHEVLKPHVETLAACGSTQTPILVRYTEECLDIVEKHRDVTHEKLKEVVSNLGLITRKDSGELRVKLRASVEKSAQTLFTTWQKAAEKEIQAGVNTSLAQHEIMKTIERELSHKDTSSNFEVCRNVVNKHIYAEANPPQVYQNIFADVYPEYSLVLCDKLVRLAIEMLPKQQAAQLDPLGLGLSIGQLHSISQDNQKLQMSYDCFVALKRVWRVLHPGEKLPDQVYETFAAHANRWHDMAIHKAKLKVEKLLEYLANNTHEFEAPSDNGAEEGDDHLEIEQDITNTTLINFQAMAESCWTWRKELDWPDPSVNLRMGLTLVKTFAKLEDDLLSVFDKIHMEDNTYDAFELSRTIKLLKGLQSRLQTSAIELRQLHEEHLVDEDADPTQQLDFKQQMEEVYQTIADMEEKQKKEIQLKVNDYCEGRRSTMAAFIKDKKLVDDEQQKIDCLMDYLDKEMKDIYACLRDECPSIVIAKLWAVMEEELSKWFKRKKKRNLQKNKPARFRHVAEAITIIIEVKTNLFNDGVIKDSDLDFLNKGRKLQEKHNVSSILFQ